MNEEYFAYDSPNDYRSYLEHRDHKYIKKILGPHGWRYIYKLTEARAKKAQDKANAAQQQADAAKKARNEAILNRAANQASKIAAKDMERRKKAEEIRKKAEAAKRAKIVAEQNARIRAREEAIKKANKAKTEAIKKARRQQQINAAKKKIANTQSPIQKKQTNITKRHESDGSTTYNVKTTRSKATIGQQYEWVRDKTGKLVRRLKKTRLNNNYKRPN